MRTQSWAQGHCGSLSVVWSQNNDITTGEDKSWDLHTAPLTIGWVRHVWGHVLYWIYSSDYGVLYCLVYFSYFAYSRCFPWNEVLCFLELVCLFRALCLLEMLCLLKVLCWKIYLYFGVLMKSLSHSCLFGYEMIIAQQAPACLISNACLWNICLISYNWPTQ